jgi:hypothetical protein
MSEASEEDNVLVIIELERCVDDQHGHSLACARHDEARFLEYEGVVRQVAQQRGARLVVNRPRSRGGDEDESPERRSLQQVISDGAAIRAGDPRILSSAALRYPRVGAFEVFVQKGPLRVEVFSKLRRLKWPNPDWLACAIDRIVLKDLGGWEGGWDTVCEDCCARRIPYAPSDEEENRLEQPGPVRTDVELSPVKIEGLMHSAENVRGVHYLDFAHRVLADIARGRGSFGSLRSDGRLSDRRRSRRRRVVEDCRRFDRVELDRAKPTFGMLQPPAAKGPGAPRPESAQSVSTVASTHDSATFEEKDYMSLSVSPSRCCSSPKSPTSPVRMDFMDDGRPRPVLVFDASLVDSTKSNPELVDNLPRVLEARELDRSWLGRTSSDQP